MCGCNQSPPPAPAGGTPVPATAPVASIVQLAKNIGAAVVAQLETTQGQTAIDALAQLDAGPAGRVCTPWKHDGGTKEVKVCCTPSVGRGGIKVAACLKFERQWDPWADQGSGQNPVIPG